MNYRVGGSGTGPFVASAANGDSWKVEHLKEATDVPVSVEVLSNGNYKGCANNSTRWSNFSIDFANMHGGLSANNVYGDGHVFLAPVHSLYERTDRGRYVAPPPGTCAGPNGMSGASQGDLALCFIRAAISVAYP